MALSWRMKLHENQKDSLQQDIDSLKKELDRSPVNGELAENSEVLSNHDLIIPTEFEWLTLGGWQEKIPSSMNEWLLSSHELKESFVGVSHISRFSFSSSEEFKKQLSVYETVINKFLSVNNITWVRFSIDTWLWTRVGRDNVLENVWDSVFKITTTFLFNKNTKDRVRSISPSLKYYESFWEDNPRKNWAELTTKLKNIDGFKYRYGDYSDSDINHISLAVWWDFDVEIDAEIKKKDVLLIPDLSSTPDWINYYHIDKGNTTMTWSLIEMGKDVNLNYISIQTDPDLFPINSRDSFCAGYEAKYWKEPLFAFAWPRTKNGKPIWLNRHTHGNNHIENTNAGSWGTWFLSIKNGKAIMKLLKDVTSEDTEWFQERLVYSDKEGNRFNTLTPEDKKNANKNCRRRRLQLSDGTNMIWQSDDRKQKMYQDIDRDSDSVYIVKNWKRVRITWVMSLESQWSWYVYIKNIWWSWENRTMLRDHRWVSNPVSNLVVGTN